MRAAGGVTIAATGRSFPGGLFVVGGKFCQLPGKAWSAVDKLAAHGF